MRRIAFALFAVGLATADAGPLPWVGQVGEDGGDRERQGVSSVTPSV